MSAKSALSIKLLPFLRVNILFFPVLASSLVFGYFIPFALSYLCALLHELTHVAVAVRLGVGVAYVEIQPFGICARLKSEVIKSPPAEIAIALAGPLSNFVFAAAAYLARYALSINKQYTEYFILCNLAIAIVNLVPALPLDGGRVLRAALTIRLGALRAYNITVGFSKIPIALLAVLSIYAYLTASFNFSLILIGAFLLGNLFAEQRNISAQALRELLYYRSKLEKDELTRTTVITARGSTPARKILRRLSYSNYHIIHVVDDKLRVVKTLTEGQLLEALTERGIRVTLGEIT